MQYTSNNDPDMGGFASMTGTELTVRGETSTATRGFQSWQDIRSGWNTIHFDEDAATDAVCTAVLPGPFPKFYRLGGTLAADIQTAMNAATCTGSAKTNVYGVTYNTGTGVFSFTRTTANRPFRIRWDRAPNRRRSVRA